MNFVSNLREPQGVGARSAADVEDNRRRRWKSLRNHFLRACKLQLGGAGTQPVGFRSFLIIAADFRAEFHSKPIHTTFSGLQAAERSERLLIGDRYFVGGGGAAGKSELNVSTMHFQLP